MTLGSIVNVAIGLILTYLVASLVASAVKEVAAGAFQWRGKYLTKGIGVLLSTSTNASFSWGGIYAWLMAHLGSVSRMAPTPSATAPAMAVAATAADAALQKVHAIVAHPLLKGTPSTLPSYVPARDFSTAVLDLLRDGSSAPVFSQVERTVAALPECDIKRILSAFLQDAGGDLDALRARIETWFDDGMDRLSGIYKRFSQYFLLALGLAIAITLNVDSVHLASALWTQPALQAQIAAHARAVSAKTDPNSPPSIPQALQELNSLPLPIGRAHCASFFGEPAPAPPANPAAVPTATPSAPPIACPTGLYYDSGWGAWNWWTILGWLITAFAISLGAPFWFGILQNVMNLRSAGPPPQRADGTPAANP